jgi:hypothetical protein
VRALYKFLTSPQPQRHLLALGAYVVAAGVFVWPLPLSLGTHLLGPPDGDLGVYIWNQWVFQHELLAGRWTPYFTEQIFSLGRPANLALHNYTAFQNLVALPLTPLVGVVAAFNVVNLVMSVLTAYLTFLLVRRVIGHHVESWIAGLFLAWSPLLVTRGMAHVSVAAAAPLAAYLLILLRAADRDRPRDAILLGTAAAWAASVDAYFAVYCVLIALAFVAIAALRLTARPQALDRRWVGRAIDGLLLGFAGLTAAILITGGWTFGAWGHVVSMRSLYTPVLLLTAFAAARIGLRHRLVTSDALTQGWVRRMMKLCVAGAAVATVLLSPMLFAAAMRVRDSGWDTPAVLWRSSPPGIDAAALLLPNPNHPLAPANIRDWLSPRPDAYFENVASIPLVVLAVLLAAWWKGWRPPRLWIGVAIAFGLLALGPFVHVAGLNTYVPGPWALLRYVPIVGLAHTPARFTVVLTLALAVLFASGLSYLSSRAIRRRLLLSLIAAALVFELLPIPRHLFSAVIPHIYAEVARAPEDARVLELPFGVRDGTSSAGNFTARSQFFQTYHHKRLIGGYLSRVSKRRVTDMRRVDMLDALIVLSEGGHLDPRRAHRLIAKAPDFVNDARVQFVVIDTARSPDELQAFARAAFRLIPVASDGPLELYRPGH